ncbi:MAG TPA: TolC family protein [Bacteroidales bacterium]|nr:TolC family protein [Bacteroidales bacterium]HNW48126.1 TolC family protein [Bacteroidales bacterium]HPS95223.1 TolC family protein [Bacteroidales bacterium]
MKIIYKLPVFILILIPTLLSAQQKLWSLEECIKYAWDNNLKIKQQELVVEESDNNLLQSKLNYVPSVSASVSHSMNWGRSVNMNDLQIIENQLSQSTSASARASINLFEGMAKNNDLKSKQVIREISVQEVSRIKNDISIEIARSYLQVLLSKEILNTAKSSLASIDEQVARTKKLVDAGSQAYSSLLEIQAQLATEKLQLTNAENQVSSNLLSLKQLLDLSTDSSFDISLPNLDNFVSDFKGVSIDELYSNSLNLPQVKSVRLSRDNSNLQLAIAKGRSYPTVSFTAAYGSYFSDTRDVAFMTQFNENRNPSLSFGLSIPVFNSWRTNTAIRNARIEVKKSDINVKSQEQLLYKEIQQAANDAHSYFARFKATEDNVKAMQESFRYVQQKFDVGTLNATDYTVAKANLFKSQSDFYQAKYQYIFQLKILDFYKGNPITL